MKLKRSKKTTIRSRHRQVPESERSAKPYGFLYRSQRADDEIDLNAPSNIPRNRDRKQSSSIIWLQRLGLFLLLIAILFSLKNILTLTPSAQISPYSSSDKTDPLFNKPAYQVKVDSILSSSIWNQNKITIDTAKISRDLKKKFPEIASVSVRLPLLGHKPTVYIEPVKLALILQTAHNGAYLLDQNGRALIESSTTPVIAQKLSLPLVVDNSGLIIAVNQQALPVNDITFIQIIQGELAAKHFTVESMTLPASSGELDVKLVGQVYTVKFNLENNDPQQQAGTFLATINQLQKQNAVPSKYIDVRVDGRAYYQ